MSDQVIRRLDLAGGFTADADWTNPANAPLASSPLLRVTGSQIRFAFVGRAGPTDSAALVDVGSLTVDSCLMLRVGGDGYARSTSSAEANGGVPISGRIWTVADDLERGDIVRLNIVALAGVGALPSLWVYLLGGAVRL